MWGKELLSFERSRPSWTDLVLLSPNPHLSFPFFASTFLLLLSGKENVSSAESGSFPFFLPWQRLQVAEFSSSVDSQSSRPSTSRQESRLRRDVPLFLRALRGSLAGVLRSLPCISSAAENIILCPADREGLKTRLFFAQLLSRRLLPPPLSGRALKWHNITFPALLSLLHGKTFSTMR